MSFARRITALAAAVCIALPGLTAAQSPESSSPQIPQLPGSPAQPRPAAPGQPGAPPRDPVQAPAAGKAIIRGRAVALDSGTPLRRVNVRLTGGPLRMPRSALTHPDGRYELKDLPAGRYRLSAGKSGFVTILYGQRGPLDPDRLIELADGQTRDKADFALPRGGALSGRITDEFGEPAGEISVQAMTFKRVGGRRRLTPMGQASTNDLGQYRIYGLPPGEYYISAGAVGGAAPTEAVTDNTSGTGYVPTYFPGTPSAADALRVTLEIGAEASADFPLLPTRVVKITGVVVDEQGQPIASAFIGLQPRDPDLAFSGATMNHITGSDGNFTVGNVAPGSYHLTASVQNRSNVPGGARIGGSVPIVVTGQDIDGVRIVASRGGTIKGRVIYEGGQPPASTGALSTRVVCQVAPGEGPMMMGSVPKPIEVSGQFEVIGIHSPCQIRALQTPPNWTLKAVLHESRDIIDRPVTLSATETVTGVQVILTNRLTTLTGGVTDANQRPTRDYVVIVHPEDVEKVGPQSRYVRIARADQEGQFKVTGLPPGDYLVAALDSIEEGAEQDREFVERIRASSVRVQLSDAAAQSLTLKLSTPQP